MMKATMVGPATLEMMGNKLKTSESEPCGQEFSFRSHKSTRITSMIKVNTKPVAVPGVTTRWGGRVLTGMEAVVVVWLALVLRILSGGTTSAQSLKPPATLRTCDEATQAPCFPHNTQNKRMQRPLYRQYFLVGHPGMTMSS